jgi:hypothetical protein
MSELADVPVAFSAFTQELATVSEIILLTDPHNLTGRVYIDYGDPKRLQFLCDASDETSLRLIADRYFDLLDRLVGDVTKRVRETGTPHRVTLNLEFDTPSAHQRLAATGKLERLLQTNAAV